MKTKEQILKECKERIQGKLSMLYWNTTIYEAMEEYATQQVNLLNKPAVMNNEVEASSEGVAVCCNTCKYVDGFRCNHPQGCETSGDYELWEQQTDL